MVRPEFTKQTADMLLAVFQVAPLGMSITEITHRSKLNKRTVMKYLGALEKKGQVTHMWFGPTKVYRLR